MDISALLLACSVHPDDALMLSIAYVHGRGSPYAIVNVGWQGLDQDDAGLVSARSPTAARAAVERILATGGEPVLGLLPVRPEWATEFGKSLDDLFDPCGDIAVASAKLSEFDHACGRSGPQRGVRRRGCTLEMYGESLGMPALRRAVMADVTLPRPFPTDAEAGNAFFVSDALTSSGLFFAVAPVTSGPPPAAPAPTLPTNTPGAQRVSR